MQVTNHILTPQVKNGGFRFFRLVLFLKYSQALLFDT